MSASEFENVVSDRVSCNRTAPGHHVFGWGVVKSLGAKPRIPANVGYLGGTAFEVTVNGVIEIWHHHDPDRFANLMGRYPRVRAVAGHYLTLSHALGEYWFNFEVGSMSDCESK